MAMMTAQAGLAGLRSCPFCDWSPNGTDSLEDHIGWFHRDRLQALALYRMAVAQGRSEGEARRIHNEALIHHGPGSYERAPKVTT